MQSRIVRFMLVLLVVVGFVAYSFNKLSLQTEPQPACGWRIFGGECLEKGNQRGTQKLQPEDQANLSILAEPQPVRRWRLFGEEYLENGNQRGTQKLQPEDQANLLTNIFRSDNEAVNRLVKDLSSLQLSCYNHQENDGVGDKYAKFLEVLSNYTKFHHQERNNESTKRLVWVCDAYHACGGLADRVKGATYALILAMLSHRVLYLSWRDRSFGEQSFLQPNAIHWHLTEEQKKVYMHDNINDMKLKDFPQDSKVKKVHIFDTQRGIGVDIPTKDLKMSLGVIEGQTQWILLETNMRPCTLLNNTKTASSEWIKKGVNALGLGRLSSDDFNGLMGLVFRYLFKFTEELLVEVGAARKALGLENQKYVGVHVRTGFAGNIKQESVNHPKLFRNTWQWDKTLSCAHHYAMKELGSSSLLFLATDSYLVKVKTLDAKYRHQFRTLNNTVIHVDKIDKFPHDAQDFETEGVLNALIDLILLAESHSIIHGKSGFSFLAKSLCFIPRTKIIDGLQCAPLET